LKTPGSTLGPAVNQEVFAVAIEAAAARVSVAISRIMALLPVVVGLHLGTVYCDPDS
jgi:hypothetical protein